MAIPLLMPLVAAGEALLRLASQAADKLLPVQDAAKEYANRANRQADAVSAQSPPPAEVEVLDVSDYRPRKIPSPTWRECIKKVWEIPRSPAPSAAGR